MQDFARLVPDGDTQERMVCRSCGHVAYENPKVIVGSVVRVDERVLLCRRAIEPRLGFWTLPAGYLELGESIEAGARREAWEEARADITLDGILAIFSLPRIGQVQVIFRGRFAALPHYAPGPESMEVRLFDWSEIPRSDLAFQSVRWALDVWRRIGDGAVGPPASAPAEEI